MISADLAAIERWARKFRLQFGDKNKYVVFHAAHTTAFDLESIGGLAFFSKKLEAAKHLLLLGLHLDPSLTFERHTEYLVAAVKRRGNMLRCLMGTRLARNAESLLTLYKGWIRPKIEYAHEVYASFAPCYATNLERAQAHCLRVILGARKSTPHAILQNETSVSALKFRRQQGVLRIYAKILALPYDHSLRKLLRRWWSWDAVLEAPLARPQSFFGCVTHTFQTVYGSLPPQEASDTYKTPVAFPPWHPLHLPVRAIDLHCNFRRQLRQRTRTTQMNTLLHCQSAAWYITLHPRQRRNWISSLPPGGALLRIIVRLRSGYAHIGERLSWAVQTRCPACGADDTIHHLLLQCIALVRARGEMFDVVAAVTSMPPTVRLLLGFDEHLSSRKLRHITSATARFVITAQRWP